MRFKHLLEYAILRCTVALINLLPLKLLLRLFSLLGHLVWLVAPIRLKVAYYNLGRIFPGMSHPDKLAILKNTYLQFSKTFALAFILHRQEMATLVDDAVISGREHLDAALAAGKGAIVTTYHGCWFEAFFAWFNHSRLPASLIYQSQANPLSDGYFLRQRTKHGTSLEHLSSKAGMEAFQQSLMANRLLIISLDQRYSGRGTDVEFFNTPFRCAKGSAVLHLRTGAPLLTSVYYVKEGRLHVDFDTVELPAYDAIDEKSIKDICRRTVRHYEPLIRRYPDQWFSLFHRLWMKRDYPAVPSRRLKELFRHPATTSQEAQPRPVHPEK